jgi:outer membrane protein
MGLNSMRYALVVAVLLVGFSGYAFWSVQAQDQAAPAQAAASGEVQGLKISVVDIDKILSASKAAKTLKAQVEEKRKGFIAEVEKAEKSLRESQKAIEKESKSLSKEDLMKKAQEFEAKRLEARKGIQDKKSKLDSAYTEAMNSLTQKIYEVCQKIADEQKIDLVITRQNIIVGSMALDITDAVLKGLDDALPSVELKVK